MAKVQRPLFSLSAWGQFAKDHVIRRHGPDHILENKPIPKDAKTSKQLAWRTMYQACTVLWHDLSAAEQAAWEGQARSKHMTGYAWYMSQCLRPNPGIYLPLAGGTMAGNIEMDSNRITGLPASAAPNDAIRQAELTTHAGLTTGAHGLKGFVGCSAYQTADQPIAHNVLTLLDWHATEWDVGGYFDLVNNCYKPLIAGKYFCAVGVRYRDFIDGKTVIILMGKNGLSHKELARQIPGDSDSISVNGSCEVDMNGSTDFICAITRQFSGAAQDTFGNIVRTWFQCHLIAQS